MIVILRIKEEKTYVVHYPDTKFFPALCFIAIVCGPTASLPVSEIFFLYDDHEKIFVCELLGGADVSPALAFFFYGCHVHVVFLTKIELYEALADPCGSGLELNHAEVVVKLEVVMD